MKSILVCAGHGGGDPGAVSPDGKMREADLALELRDKVSSRLRAEGMTVINDGTERQNQPLVTAIQLARRTNGPRVEFHFNAGPPAATGVEALSTPQHKRLAQDLAAAVSAATGLRLRGAGGWKDQGAGQHHRLGFCQAGGVILELAFLSNAGDMALYRKNFDAIVAGICEVLKKSALK